MSKGGVYPEESKLTENSPSWQIKSPPFLYIHMKQHIGSPCEPLVKTGDKIRQYQKIADSKAFISAPVHAPLSGEVVGIEKYPHPDGMEEKSIILKTSYKETILKEKDTSRISSKQILKIVREAGIVGLGGAMFPTHVKLTVPKGRKAEFLVINGAECEPFLTADHRLMVENPEEIKKGIHYVLKAVKAKKAIIGIESNKQDAIKALGGDPAIKIRPLRTKYPQGAEKVIVRELTGRTIADGMLPIDVGVVVCNVGTIFAIFEAVTYRKPLVSRIVTVTGDVKNPGNVIAPLGTPFSHMIAECGGYKGKPKKIICGGPMMGLPQPTDQTSLIKGNNGIIVFNHVSQFTEETCIRCGRCVDACPAGLVPTTIMKFAKKGHMGFAKANGAKECFECGSCSYVCPSKIDLVGWIRMAKK